MKDFRAFLALAGGVLVHLVGGMGYTWGNINPYVTSYIRRYSHPHTLTYGDTVWVGAVMVLGHGFTVWCGGVIEKRVGTRLATLTGCMITSVGMFISAFSIKVSYYLFLFTYAFMTGAGVGISTAPPLAVAMAWFPERKGLVNGIVFAGVGGAAFTFNQIQRVIVNPHDVKPIGAALLNTTQNIGDDKYFIDEDVLRRVPTMFMVLGCCYAAFQIVGVILLFPADSQSKDKVDEYTLLNRNNISDKPLNEQGPDAIDSDSTVADNLFANELTTNDLTNNVPPSEMIRKRTFLTCWFIFMVNVLSLTFVVELYKAYGLSLVVDDDLFLTTVGSFASLCNAVGRVLWGLYADHARFQTTVLTLTGSMTVLMGTFYLSHIFADSAGKELLFTWICLIYLTFSGNFTLFFTAIAKIYGTKHVSVNAGILFTAMGVAGPAAALLSSILLEKIQFYGIFILSASLSAVSFLVALTINARQADGTPI